MRRLSLGIFCVLAVHTHAACDPEKELSKCFQRFGLNRVAVLRDDIRVGAIVLAKGSTAIYGDNVSDYVSGQDEVSWNQIAADYSKDFNAALASCSTEKVFNPEMALSVVDAILPVKISDKLKLNTKVSVEQIDGKGTRISIPDVSKYLVLAASAPFRKEMRTFHESGVKTFFTYEVISAKKIKMTAEGGQEIGAGLEVGKTSVISEGKFSLEIKKTSRSTLELDTGRYYVTSIRTGELVAGKGAISLTFKPLDFKVPGGTVKAVADSTFSALISPEGEPLVLSDASPSTLLKTSPPK